MDVVSYSELLEVNLDIKNFMDLIFSSLWFGGLFVYLFIGILTVFVIGLEQNLKFCDYIQEEM